MVDAIPITMPIRIVWPSRHDGHQRVGTDGLGPRFGAAIAMATALKATNTDHSASAQRQSPWAAGSAPTGVVSAVGSVSPMRMPLLYTAVAMAIRLGNQSRTIAGEAGRLTAAPSPIRKEDGDTPGVLGP